MSGVIRNAACADARFIGSVNVTTTVGVRFVPAPRGDAVITPGGRTSTIVQVSLPAGVGSTFPARSRARVRNAYTCPSSPTKFADVAAVPMEPGTWVHGP